MNYFVEKLKFAELGAKMLFFPKINNPQIPNSQNSL